MTAVRNPKSAVKLLLARNRRAYRTAAKAVNLARYVARRPHERDFAALASFADRPGIFLDVGANQGQSAMSFRIFDKAMPILSIEANPAIIRNTVLLPLPLGPSKTKNSPFATSSETLLTTGRSA